MCAKQGKVYDMKEPTCKEDEREKARVWVCRYAGSKKSVRRVKLNKEGKNGGQEKVIKYARTFSRVGSPFRSRVRCNCLISFSRRLGRPGYILEPPERTICL